MSRNTTITSSLVAVIAVLLLAPAAARADDGKIPAVYQGSYDLEASGQYKQALATLERIPAEERGTYVFKLRHAWLSYLSGKHNQAVKSYQAAASIAPKALEAQIGQLLPLLALRRWKVVVSTSRTILKSAPGNGVVRGRLAWALYNQGKYKDSAAEYARVVEAFPSDVDMRAGLGWALLKDGKGAEAAPHFRQVLKVAPKHSTARSGILALGSAN